jgi:hypothetical protein
MRRLLILAVLASVLALPSVGFADGAEVVPQQFCGVQLEAGGPIFFGQGITVVTPSGGQTVVCKVFVPEGTESTQVLLVGEPKGNIVVFTRSGRLVVVFTICGPSEPTDVCT